MNVVFDIETNGFLDELTRCVCLSYCIVDPKQDPSIPPHVETAHDASSIADALEVLSSAEVLVGHNALGFDLLAIRKLYPRWKTGASVRDTLVLSRLCFPDQRETDLADAARRGHLGGMTGGLPGTLIGSHSLEAWGHRLGIHKSSAPFDAATLRDLQYTPTLGEYCAQDVRVTLALHRRLSSVMPSGSCVELEHGFAKCVVDQMTNGFAFDSDAAASLYAVLAARREELVRMLQETVPPTEVRLKTKTKIIPFNPGSRQQIAKAMISMFGWKPSEYTPSGEVKVDETTLASLNNPVAQALIEYLTIQKRIGMLAEGDEAWLKVVRGGRIHGYCNHNGAVTGRCTHRSPNMAQVPGVGSPYGKECRSLFVAPPGRVLVGVDASGLELRCLAHYMSRYPGGVEFMEELLKGDIHSANQKAAGLPTRNDAKTFIYAFLYGAGPAKLGTIVGGGYDEGKQMQARFLSKVPALKRLKAGVESRARHEGFLVGLDGRRLPVRSQHAALNTLLQSAGAVIMKQATCLMNEGLRTAGIDFRQVAHVHDEVQFEVPEQEAHRAAEIVKEAIAEAGRRLGFRCPLAGESRVGRNWAETH